MTTRTLATRGQPAIRAVLALMTALGAVAVVVAAVDGYAMTRMSDANARKLAGVVGRATGPDHTDVVGLAGSMRLAVTVSLVFTVLSVVVALLALRVTLRALDKGRVVIWVAALVVGILQMLWVAAEPTDVFQSAAETLQAEELRQAGAASLYAQLSPGWYPWVYYLFEFSVIAVLVATTILLLRPGVAGYYVNTRAIRD